jgi:DNA-binding SARP family transcriptional activator/tetratricopeptide (TPR) repeat protein
MLPTTIRLCGRMAVELAGVLREGDLPGRQGRLALAYLALNHGRPVAREELVEAVWGEAAGRGHAQSLNVLLSKLRRALDPSVIEGVRTASLQLGDHVEVDLRRVHDAVAEVRRAVGAEEWAAIAGPARVVCEHADRGLLVGLEARWIDEARRELEELALEARAAQAEAGLAGGGAPELAAAERVARTLVERSPYRESGHVLLMRVLEAQGNVAEALRVYDRLRHLLREELGVVPSRGVQVILERLLRQEGHAVTQALPVVAAKPDGGDAGGGADGSPSAEAERTVTERSTPAPARPAATALPFFATRSRAAFVGRHAELESLRRHLERATAGERQLVLLEGEPGIGKTRLAARFAAECHAAGATVLYGRCDAETLIPYQPFIEAVRTHVAQVPRSELRARLGVHAQELARVLPELAQDGADAGAAAGVPTERYRLFEAVSAVLVDAARSRPVLLVLDDLHWADRPTLLMLRQAVRATEGAPLLVLVTYRDTERGDALLDTLADLRREHFLERIALRGLAERDAAALVHQLITDELRGGVDEALLGEAMGNPFFLEEMIRGIGAGSAPAREGHVDADRRPPVPEGIREVLGRRMARLSESTRRLLRAASVIGREFPLEVLEEVAGMSEDELDAGLEEATTAQVILEIPDEYGRYAFSHALIRQTLYDDLSATRRARLHGRVAEILEALAGDDPAILSSLAYHFFRAPPVTGLPKAVEYAERAARHADGQLAYEEAARLYELAAHGLERLGPDDPRKARLLPALGEAHVKAGNSAAARAAFSAAHALARARGDAEGVARAALGYGATAHIVGGVVNRTTVARLEEALEAIGEEDTPLRARLLARLAIELRFSGEGERERVAALPAEAMGVAERLGDPASIGYALIARHWCLWGPENVQDRLATADDLLELARRSRDKNLQRQGHQWRMMDLLELGDIVAVDAEIAAFERLAQERRRLFEQFYVQLFRAMRAILAGRFDEVEALAREAMRLGERVQDPNASQAWLLQMLALRREQGRLAEMTEPVADHVARFPAIPGWRCVRAHVPAQLGEEEAARAELDALARGGFAALPIDGLWLGGIALLAEVAADLGDASHAAALYERLLPYAHRNVTLGWVSVCIGSASRPLGLLAALLDEPEVAGRHFEEALELHARMGAEPLLARTELDYAGLLLRTGTQRRGGELLDAARARGEALGMSRLVEEADARGRRASRRHAPVRSR